MANKQNSRLATTKSGKPVKHNLARKSKLPKEGGWQEQWCYAIHGSLSDMWRQPLATMLTVMVIAISLTMPSVCYMIWKNISQATDQWYPIPHLTAYLSKTLSNDAAENIVAQLKKENGIAKINYLSREDALDEFRNWSGFGGIMVSDLLEQNPLPAVAVITPNIRFQHSDTMNHLRARICKIQGIDEVQMDDSWFNRLTALTYLIAQVAAMIGILMIFAIFLVIGNSIRLSIFAQRDTINIQKLIGATDGFILRPFLYGGSILGLIGALLSLVLSETLVVYLDSVVIKVATVFQTSFVLQGLGYDESILLLLIAAMIGWLAAWIATVQHLRRFTPQ